MFTAAYVFGSCVTAGVIGASTEQQVSIKSIPSLMLFCFHCGGLA